MGSTKANAKPTRGRNALADGDLRDRFIPYGVPVGFQELGPDECDAVYGKVGDKSRNQRGSRAFA